MSIPQDPTLPLRLAFSHREKADAAIRQCDRSFAKGEMERAHHDNLRAVYLRERETAERRIAQLLNVERARAESIEAQRRAVLEEQVHLPERVQAGKLSAQAANDTNRRLNQRLAELDAQLAAVRDRIEAKTAEQLGGFVDLPFSDYASAGAASFDVTLRRLERRGLGDWYLAFALAIAAGTAVFLPWFSAGGVTTSLVSGGDNLLHVAREAGLPASAARYAWIGFAVAPFLAVLLTVGRSARVMGWGMLALGLAMLAAGAFPGLLLGTRGGGPANLVELTASFRPGAALYMACAVGFIVLGAFRVSPPGDSLRHAAAVSVALFVAVAGVVLLAALALMGARSTPRVTFQAEYRASANDRVLFSVRNEGNTSVACYLPLPEDTPINPPFSLSRVFGLRMQAKEEGDDDFRSAPAAPFVWRLSRDEVPVDGFVIVEPGMAVEGYLDFRQLATLGVEAVTLRIGLFTAAGKLLESQEVDLPGSYLSPAAPVRDPVVIPAPPNRQPTAAGSNPSATPPKPEAPPAPTATETPAPAAPIAATGTPVEFAGVIGGKAIVRLDAGLPSQTEVIAAPGEPVGQGWTLETIVKQPSSLMLKHESGATVQVIRGHIVEIRATDAAD